MSDHPLIIRSSDLTVRIDRLGAELRSMRDGQGREGMTDADPRWWTGHAPLLFPFVGRSRCDAYRMNGRTYSMPQHGFARRADFALEDHAPDRLLLRLEADATTRAVYPFDFRLDMNFTLEGATLRMTATISNRGEARMPFSFGYHPAFAWPLPFGGSVEDHRIIFDKPEPAPIRRVGDEPGLISPAARSPGAFPADRTSKSTFPTRPGSACGKSPAPTICASNPGPAWPIRWDLTATSGTSLVSWRCCPAKAAASAWT